MKKNHNLDEMQERKMLTIEHNGYWLALWGLLAVILAQMLLGQTLADIGGELVVIFLMTGYLMVGCLRNGLWDRHLKADRKTNLMGSFIAAAIVAVVSLVYLGMKLGNLRLALIFTVILTALTFILCLVTLSVTANIYRRKRQELDSE